MKNKINELIKVPVVYYASNLLGKKVINNNCHKLIKSKETILLKKSCMLLIMLVQFFDEYKKSFSLKKISILILTAWQYLVFASQKLLPIRNFDKEFLPSIDFVETHQYSGLEKVQSL